MMDIFGIDIRYFVTRYSVVNLSVMKTGIVDHNMITWCLSYAVLSISEAEITTDKVNNEFCLKNIKLEYIE